MSNVIPFCAHQRARRRAEHAIHQMIEYRDYHAERVIASLEALLRTRKVLPPEYDDAGDRLLMILSEGFANFAARKAESA